MAPYDNQPPPQSQDPRETWYQNVILANPDKYDTNRSKAQWLAWYPLYDAASGGFRLSKTVDGQPYNGIVEHPDACPEGYAAFGKNDCRRVGAGGGAGGGYPGAPAPGGRPGGGPGGAGGGLEWGDLSGMLGGFKPNLGNDYGLGNIYQNLLKGGKGAMDFLAPLLSQSAHDYQNAQGSIMRGMPAGGQRDKALADIASKRATAGISARQSLLPSALSGLQGLYNTQLGAGNQQFGDILGAYTSGKGFQNQFDIARMNDITNRDLGFGNLGLGYANLGERGREFDVGMDWDKNRFGQEFGERQREFNVGQGNWQNEFNLKKKAANRSFWSSIFGGAMDLGKMFGLSDMRTKENVKPFERGLEALRKINTYEYDYNGKAGSTKGEHAVSVMAQELEKVAPEAVKTMATPDLPDAKMVDLGELLAMTINSIKELDARTRRRRS